MTPLTVLVAGALASGGTSPIAAYVDAQATAVLDRLFESELFGVRALAESIDALAREGADRGWDGRDAMPISSRTVFEAKRLIACIPSGVPLPTVAIEPDGMFVFEWYRSPTQLLSLSVDSDGVLHFAAIMGNARRYGQQSFVGVFPPDLRDLASRVMAR